MIGEALAEALHWTEETGTTFALVLVLMGLCMWIAAGLVFVLYPW